MADPIVVDYSYARPGVPKLITLNAVGVMRYVSHSTKGKNLTVGEAKAILDADMWLGIVFEDGAGRAKQGNSAGGLDRQFAEQQCDQLGVPADVPIFMAVDVDVQPAAVIDYVKGAAGEARRPMGLYGGYDIINALVVAPGRLPDSGRPAAYGWQTSAWSEGKISANAHLYQFDYVGDYDRNRLLKPFPTWSKTQPPPPPPTGVRIPVDDGRRVKVIAGGRITTAYGVTGDWMAGYHPGDDWNGVGDDYGMPACSPVEGTVVGVGLNVWPIDAYGRQVVIEDVLGFRTSLCHLSRTNVTKGQKIRAGTAVGAVGATGRVTGPHVHVERRKPAYGYWQHLKPRYDYPYPMTKLIVVDELVQGSRCASVYWLQRALNRAAIAGKKLPLSGYFGTDTLALVKRLQVDNFGDVGDGLLGPRQTKRLLELTNLTTVEVA